MDLKPWQNRILPPLAISFCVAALLGSILCLMPEPAFQSLLQSISPVKPAPYYKISLDEFTHERQPGQFILKVRLHNELDTPLDNIQAVITINRLNQPGPETTIQPIEPSRLNPGQAVAFTIVYKDDDPVYRYSIHFKSPNEAIVPHRVPPAGQPEEAPAEPERESPGNSSLPDQEAIL